MEGIQGKTKGKQPKRTGSVRRYISRVCLLIPAMIVLICLTAAGMAQEPSVTPAGKAQEPSVPATVKLPSLPYAQNALAPHISARAMSFHYGRHYLTYVENVQKLTAGTPWEGQPLDKIVLESAGQPDKTAIFNNAAQAWNHAFFWQSMKRDGGSKPPAALLKKIEASFGSFDKFKEAFKAAAVSQFGSGWVWLVKDGDGLKIITTSNADTPLAHGQTALLTCDVWEHAYYLDYQHRRADFVQAFLDHLVNWDFAVSRMK